nr:FUSC family protein [Asaia astilbis]
MAIIRALSRLSTAPTSFGRVSQLLRRDRWAWLYAPSAQSVEFALRNTVAALLALAIAMWMELDSPIWATMTVWAVAQGTRGESFQGALAHCWNGHRCNGCNRSFYGFPTAASVVFHDIGAVDGALRRGCDLRQ